MLPPLLLQNIITLNWENAKIIRGKLILKKISKRKEIIYFVRNENENKKKTISSLGKEVQG